MIPVMGISIWGRPSPINLTPRRARNVLKGTAQKKNSKEQALIC